MRAEARTIRFADKLSLEGGRNLDGFELAIETYGTLNAARDNAVLLCHGLTATQHAAAIPGDSRRAWWDAAIGPGRAIDTDRFHVVSVNALGSYGGSTGPASLDPATGQRFAMRFPVITIGDMVASQVRLADRLGISRFHAAIGGCMGGFQVLEWLHRAPQRIAHAIVISATARTSSHNTALWSVLRRAIMSDPAWAGGDYYDGPQPDVGMGLMACFGALFWMSRETLERRFGLRRAVPGPGFDFSPEFEVEVFLERIAGNAGGALDPNALLYLTRAIDYFDLTAGDGGLRQALAGVSGEVTLASYRSDWRYPSAEMEEINTALTSLGVSSRHVVLDSEIGHGAFLYDVPSIAPLLRAALEDAPMPAADGRTT